MGAIEADFDIKAVAFEDENIRLTVFEAIRKKEKTAAFIKKYTCKDFIEVDALLKEAIVQASQPFPLWAGLVEVRLPTIAAHHNVQVFFIYDRFLEIVPREFICNNDRKNSYDIGLAAYTVGRMIYQSEGVTKVAVYEARSNRTQTEVVIKTYGPLNKLNNANTKLMEAMVQAIVQHPHNCRIYDIAIYEDGGRFKLSLVMEKLSKDVYADIEIRIKENRKYSEIELMSFLEQVTEGLIQAKIKVKYTQRVAHRDIKPHNIFIASDGQFKVGDFGSVISKRRLRLSNQSMSSLSAEEYCKKLFEEQDDGSGTLHYVSFQTLQSMLGTGIKIDAFASDVFSLGATLLHLATFELPNLLETLDEAEIAERVNRAVESLPYSKFLKDLQKGMLSVREQDRPILEKIKEEIARELFENFQPHCDFDEHTPEELAIKENEMKVKISYCDQSSFSKIEVIKNFCLLSRIYFAQKKYEQTEALALKLIKETKNSYRKDVPCIATGYRTLCGVYFLMHRFRESEESGLKSLEMYKRLFGESSHQVSDCHAILSQVYREAENYAAAEYHLLRNLEINRHLVGECHITTSHSYAFLSDLYLQTEKFTESEQLANKSLSILQELPGGSPRYLSRIYEQLACIYIRLGRTRELEECEKHSLMCLEGLPENHPLRLEISLKMKILSNLFGGNFKESEKFTRQYESNKQQQSGYSSALSLESTERFFLQQFNVGNYKQAEELGLVCLNHYQKVGKNLSVARIHNVLSEMYSRMGRYAEAESAALESLKASQRISPPNLMQACISHKCLSQVYRFQCKFSEAESHARQSLQLAISQYGENHECTIDAYNAFVSLYMRMSRYQEAESYVLKAVSILQQLHGPNHSVCLQGHIQLAVIYSQTGRVAQAEEDFKRYLPSLLAAMGGDHPDYLIAEFNYGEFLFECERFDECESLFLQMLTKLERIGFQNSPILPRIYLNLSNLFQRKGNCAEATKYWNMMCKVGLI